MKKIFYKQVRKHPPKNTAISTKNGGPYGIRTRYDTPISSIVNDYAIYLLQIFPSFPTLKIKKNKKKHNHRQTTYIFLLLTKKFTVCYYKPVVTFNNTYRRTL
tara:strand:+ start:1028 stop:1336 length:309 start_codon:yes stop_codon:yes gene_type:complete